MPVRQVARRWRPLDGRVTPFPACRLLVLRWRLRPLVPTLAAIPGSLTLARRIPCRPAVSLRVRVPPLVAGRRVCLGRFASPPAMRF